MRENYTISLQLTIRLLNGCHKLTIQFNHRFKNSIQLSFNFNSMASIEMFCSFLYINNKENPFSH